MINNNDKRVTYKVHLVYAIENGKKIFADVIVFDIQQN